LLVDIAVMTLAPRKFLVRKITATRLFLFTTGLGPDSSLPSRRSIPGYSSDAGAFATGGVCSVLLQRKSLGQQAEPSSSYHAARHPILVEALRYAVRPMHYDFACSTLSGTPSLCRRRLERWRSSRIWRTLPRNTVPARWFDKGSRNRRDADPTRRGRKLEMIKPGPLPLSMRIEDRQGRCFPLRWDRAVHYRMIMRVLDRRTASREYIQDLASGLAGVLTLDHPVGSRSFSTSWFVPGVQGSILMIVVLLAGVGAVGWASSRRLWIHPQHRSFISSSSQLSRDPCVSGLRPPSRT